MIRIAKNLEEAIFRGRLNRFIGEIEINGKKQLCHILNPGRMQLFLKPGVSILVENRAYENPQRKIPYSLLYVKIPSTLILIDTSVPNAVFYDALLNHEISAFAIYQDIKKEKKYGHEGHSRIDFLLDQRIYIEVKSSNYAENHIGYFPDAPSTRAQRHIKELLWVLNQNKQNEAWVVFLGQRSDITEIRPFDMIDPEFGRLLRLAVKQGLKTCAYRIDFLDHGYSVKIGKSLPVVL